MKIQYFEQTDTLYIEFRHTEIAESCDYDDNTLLDIDAEGNICGMTLEHARKRTDIPSFSYENIVEQAA
jgi:uncharacterized protein YuzE